MLFQNADIHNVEELIPGERGGTTWLRLPKAVYDTLDEENGRNVCCNSTGVELRFVMKSDTVTLRMRTAAGLGVFHVYRGSIQGGWEDHELPRYATTETTDFVIRRSANLPLLRQITTDFDYPFAPEVVRVVFDRGRFELMDIIGDIEPPRVEQLPKRTILFYGSSITHGSNAIDASHTFAALVGHNLKMDVRNLGMAGACRMEPAVAEHLASEGEAGHWDVAVMELGINVLGWTDEQICERLPHLLRTVARKNADKPIFVISPFYCNDDYRHGGKADHWREMIAQIVGKEDLPNLTYVNGLDLLGDMSLISADEVHPNIYGVAQIAARLEACIRKTLRI